MAACFSTDSVEGLPCTADEFCADGYACVVGYCRTDGSDGTERCGDDENQQGEYCYLDGDRQVLLETNNNIAGYAVADLDADDDLDVVAAAPGGVTLLLNEGGAFSPFMVDANFDSDLLDDFVMGGDVGSIPIAIGRIAAGDFGGGPPTDIVLQVAEVLGGSEALQNVAEARLWVADNGGDGSFTLRPLLETAPIGDEQFLPQGLVAGDFDGDGDDDLFVAYVPDGQITSAGALFRATAPGQFEDPVDIATGGGTAAPILVDIDGDGAPEVLILSVVNNVLAVIDSAFIDSAAPPRGLDLAPSARDVNPGDLDDDGVLDLIVAFEGEEQVGWLRGTGDGNFEPLQTIPAASSLSAGVADMDRDGFIDLVMLSDEGILLQAGFPEGEYGVPWPIAPEAGGFLDIVDFNGDETPDLLLTGNRRIEVAIATP